ncbi:hypothetical protein ANRL2_03784 [Anaerolineae bacterium]|nr:hypothetical protein ANRL2_03784 [Anaerolineae bacterium]
MGAGQIQENRVTSPIPDVRNRRRIQDGESLHRLRTSGIGLREALHAPVVRTSRLPFQGAPMSGGVKRSKS